MARTRNVCTPNARLRYVRGDEHAVQGPLMCLHSNLEPACEELNLNVAVRAVVGLRGPAVIVVFGFESSGVIPSAFAALRRRPFWMNTLSPAGVSTPARIAFLSCATVSDELSASRSAATPATCGVAIEVPSIALYVLPLWSRQASARSSM